MCIYKIQVYLYLVAAAAAAGTAAFVLDTMRDSTLMIMTSAIILRASSDWIGEPQRGVLVEGSRHYPVAIELRPFTLHRFMFIRSSAHAVAATAAAVVALIDVPAKLIT